MSFADMRDGFYLSIAQGTSRLVHSLFLSPHCGLHRAESVVQ